MENVVFVLNNNWSVNVSLNLLTNNSTGLQTRLEPRLIEILHILAKNEGKLVSREDLISKIWNNYGGAEDGLNQGISILRKVLEDSNKQLIETVPKRGYILHAAVTDKPVVEKKEPPKDKISGKKYFYLAILSGTVVLMSLLLFISGRNKIPGKSEKLPKSFSLTDSVVSTNWQGKNYKLVFGENRKITLFENNIPMADSNLVNYEIVIQELKDKHTANQDAKRQ